ncbi:hypothetical protein [Clostridium perfringens str. 13]|uniref:DUF3006 domain-containing protein n=4 Tax=Clostridium perfringens TaxID=1502 RepID=Q8XMU2_CLOPE|nr:hypothetical protein [Clostridium perfringens str. 13]
MSLKISHTNIRSKEYKMKKIIVDRIEGHFIVCEDEKENILELKKDDVIGDVKEGDVLVKGKEGKFCLDKALTEKRKKEIEDLMKGMWE